MSEQGTPEAPEAEIAVHWQEEANVNPPEKLVVQANLTDNKFLERFSLDNFPDCFKEYAGLLDWYGAGDVTLDKMNPPFWRWFVGGRINASYNCVDCHLAEHKNNVFPEPEQEPIQHVADREHFVSVNEVATLLRDFCDWPYMAGDGALQAADGCYRILGRIDDVINVAGHRLGTNEIESASLLVEEIAEAGVVPARYEIKGRVPDLYVSLKPGLDPSEEIRKRVEDSVIREIGPIARPRPCRDRPRYAKDPFSGAISNEDAGDILTLAKS